jgi:hypothetical protein
MINQTKQLGFHYYSDTDHYDEASLDYWLPKLLAVGTRWLVLSIIERAEIPENFLKRVTAAGIEPIICPQFSISNPPQVDIFRERMSYYRKNGVHLVQLYNYPNMKSAWTPDEWKKQKLVERFIELFSRYAQICIEQKIIPIFPLLQPGGDYWDISFLKESLHVLQQKKYESILSNLIFSADAGFQEHALDWGKGGPEAYHPVYAYQTGQIDHRGFHIFEWYQAILHQSLKKYAPMILFQTGRWSPNTGPFDLSPKQAKQQLLKILALLQEQAVKVLPQENPEIPPYIISCNLYKLPSEFLTNLKTEQESRKFLKDVLLHNKVSNASRSLDPTVSVSKSVSSEIGSVICSIIAAITPYLCGAGKQFVILVVENFVKIVRSLIAIFLRGESYSSYFLIPDAESLLTEGQREIIRQYINKTNCKSGKNLYEALSSSKVILLNDSSLYPRNVIKQLRYNNCQIQTLSESNYGN